jgi:hypothetical protein
MYIDLYWWLTITVTHRSALVYSITLSFIKYTAFAVQVGQCLHKCDAICKALNLLGQVHFSRVTDMMRYRKLMQLPAFEA